LFEICSPFGVVLISRDQKHWEKGQKFLLPTDTQENCFKRSIKIYIKTAPACFGVITIIRERTIWAC